MIIYNIYDRFDVLVLTMLQVLAGRLARCYTSRSAKPYRKEALAVYS